jgi:hypothetical protein
MEGWGPHKMYSDVLHPKKPWLAKRSLAFGDKHGDQTRSLLPTMGRGMADALVSDRVDGERASQHHFGLDFSGTGNKR